MKTTIKELIQQMKGHSDTTKEKMVREFCLQVVDEVVEDRQVYFYSKEGTDDVIVEPEMINMLKEKI